MTTEPQHPWDSIIVQPEHGTLTRIDTGEYYYDDNGFFSGQYGLAFTYVADPGFTGTDSFVYRLGTT